MSTRSAMSPIIGNQMAKSLCANEEYICKFMLLGLLASSIGMLSANAVTLKDDISDRCVVVQSRQTGQPQLRSQSHDAIVGGGFGIAAAAFAFAALCYSFMCPKQGKIISPMLCRCLLGCAVVAFAVVGSIQLARVEKADERCLPADRNGEWKLPDVEIAGVVVSGLAIIGLVAPACVKYL